MPPDGARALLAAASARLRAAGCETPDLDARLLFQAATGLSREDLILASHHVIATAQQARDILKLGVFYETAEETLRENGFAPNRNGGNQGFLRKVG